MNIAIIGAGFSGANLYALLKQKGYSVTVFEKSRGAGGRCSTRYIGDKLIDHGTFTFEAHSDDFKNFCDTLVNENILKLHNNTYIPTNGINKICTSLIDPNDLVKNTQITTCEHHNQQWELKDKNGLKYEGFDQLIITIPAPQILQLNISLSNEFQSKLQSVSYDTIATLMVYSHENAKLDEKLFNKDIFFGFFDNSSKYQYENFSSYVIHLDKALSNLQNFQSKDDVQEFMLQTIQQHTALEIEKDFNALGHLWKYAFVQTPLKDKFLYDQQTHIGLCGDYFFDKNLESSFLSSTYLSKVL